MAGALKKSTYLTGMLVAQTPRYTLDLLYGKILRIIQKLPEESAYKKHTEALVKERSAIVKANIDVAELEKKIGCGQVEELIIQAQNELTLARNMEIWKPWERVDNTPPPHQWTWPPHK